MRLPHSVVAALSALVFTTALPAADFYWDGSSDNNWGTLANWSTVIAGGTNPGALPGASDLIYLNANAVTTQVGTLGANRSALGLVFNVNSTTAITLGTLNDYVLTLGSSGINVNNAASAAHTINSAITLGTGQTWNNVSASALTINGTVTAGSNALTVNNSATASGTIILNGAMSFGGNLTVNNGNLVLNTTPTMMAGLYLGSSGSNATRLTLGSGVAWTIAGGFGMNSTAGPGGIIDGAGSLVIGTGGRPLVVNDSPTAEVDLFIKVGVSGVSGNSWRKEGAGTMSLQGTNSYQGALDIYRGGLIADYTINNTQKLATSNATNIRGARLSFVGNATAATADALHSLNITSGTSTVSLQSNGGQNLTITLNNGLSRNTSAGVVNFLFNDTATTSLIATGGATNNSAGFLGGWAIFNGDRWASKQTGTNRIVAYTTNVAVENDKSLWTSTQHVVADGTLTGSLITPEVATLILDNPAGGTLALDNHASALTLANAALLVSDDVTGPTAITGGQLMTKQTAVGASSELIITNLSTGTLSISANIGASNTYLSATEHLTLAGNGTLALSGKNNYNGNTAIQGVVTVSGGNALSDYGSLTLSAGGNMNTTNVHGGALLDLNNGTEGIGNLGGGSWQSGQGSSEVRVGTGTLILNQTAVSTYSGMVSGTGTIIKRGSATLNTQYTPWLFSGTMQVEGGKVLVNTNGYNGLNALTNLVIRGGELEAAQNSTAQYDALGNSATVRLQGTSGNGFYVSSNQNLVRQETVSVLALEGGSNTISLNNTSASFSTSPTTTLSFSSTAPLTRINASTLLVRGTNLGLAAVNTAANARLNFTNSTGQAAVNSQLVGDSSNTGTKLKILPFALGDISATGVGNSFLTHDNSLGFRALTDAEYVNTYAAGANTDNLSLSSTAIGLNTAVYNSLRVVNTAGTVNLTGNAGQSLTLTSGALLVSAGTTANASTISGFSNLYAGASDATPDELIVSVTSTNAGAALTISSNISDNGVAVTGLTKSGNGLLKLEGTQSYTGVTTVNQGVLEFATATSLGNGGRVRLAGGTLRWSTGNTADISGRTLELLGSSVYLTPGYGGNILSAGSTLDIGSNNVTFASSIGNGGYGGLTKIGAGKLTLSGGVSYTGSTVLKQGEIEFSTIAANTTEALYILPQAGATTLKATVNSGLNLQSLVVGGIYDTNTGGAQADLEVKGGAVSIGRGDGDDFVMIGYRDPSASTAAAASAIQGKADFSAASSVNINVNTLQLGVIRSAVDGAANSTAKGELILSNTANTITASSVIVGNAPSATNNFSNASTITLGSGTNVFNTDVFVIGGIRSTGNVVFNATPGSFTLRGQQGGSTGANLFIGDNDTSTQSNTVGNLNLIGATAVDMKVNQLVLGRSANATVSNLGYGQGTLTFDIGTLQATTIRMADASYSTGSNNLAATQGTLNQRGTAKVQFLNLSQGRGTATYNWQGGTIQNLSGANLTNENVTITLEVGSGSATDVSRRVFTVDENQTATFQADAEFVGSASFTKDGSGSLILNGTNTNTGHVYISQGQISLAGSGSMNDAAWFNLGTGASLNITNRTGGTYTSDAVISGTGSFGGTGSTFTVGSNVGSTNTNGILKPGASSVLNSLASATTAGDGFGTLSVSGNLVLAAGASRAQLQIGATNRNASSSFAGNMQAWVDALATNHPSFLTGTGSNQDLISVEGTLTLNNSGTIQVLLADGYTGQFGDVFNLFDWVSGMGGLVNNGFTVGDRYRNGTETGLDLLLPQLGNGFSWDTSQFLNYGVLVVVPEPGRMMLLIIGLAGLVMRRRRSV